MKIKLLLAFEKKSNEAISTIDDTINNLDKTIIGFYPNGAVGIEALENIIKNKTPEFLENSKEKLTEVLPSVLQDTYTFDSLVNDFEKDGNGLIMTMGKGGVGKTTIASKIALALANKGHKVVLSTTDPASHLEYVAKENDNLAIEKIDPKVVTQNHINEVIAQNEGKISPEDMALLKEELSTPCIEEIAVFKAFAKTVAKAKNSFVVLDTAPTGHTYFCLMHQKLIIRKY